MTLRSDAPRIVDFASAILRHVPDHAAVLEIGAGEGALAAVLTKAGLRITAIDPNPREGFSSVIPTALEDYEPGRRFDCIATQLVLHHAGDIDAFIAKMVGLTTPNGIVAVDDYGWERSDDPEFRADLADLHTSAVMLGALDRVLDRVFYRDHAYFEEGAASDLLAFTYIGRPRTGGTAIVVTNHVPLSAPT